jgi:hypothetical protein
MTAGYRLVSNFAEARRRATTGRALALTVGAEYGLAQARRVVPIEEGTLERSGATDVDPDKGEATISFDTPYARRQHEDLSLRHDSGRQAKYLEQPLNGTRQTILTLMAEQIRRALDD